MLHEKRGITEDGFKTQAKLALARYEAFRETEYDTMVARARTAKQFERFKTEAALYPNIEWIRTRSASPRELHLNYVGLVLPINDPFWNENQPGNLWNCKCDWKTTDKPANGTPDEIVPPAVGLEGNPAETGELFTENHPYFDRHKNAPGWLSKIADLILPDEYAFGEVQIDGATILEHVGINEGERALNRGMAEILLLNGYGKIKLLPQIRPEYPLLRRRYFGGDYKPVNHAGNPDAVVDGEIWEFKKCNRRHAAEHVKDASEKSNVVFLHITEILTDDYLNRLVQRQFDMADRLNVKKIVIYNDGRLREFVRKQKTDD